MPDESYEYLVGMRDEMSGPAHRVAGGLDEMSASLKRSDAALRAHGQAHQDAARHVREHESALHGASLGFAKSLLGLGGMTAAIAEGELIAHIFERAGELAREGIKFAVEASEFKEAATQAYEVTLGTAREGELAFRALDQTAREIHMPAEKAHELASRLMLEGVKGLGAITDTVQAIGDLQRVGMAAGAERLERLIDSSIAAGHLQMRGPRSLAGTGVSMDALAAELGMSRKKFELELKQGRITVEQGIAAIDSAILHGKVGELATKKFTVSDAFTDLKNSIRGVFQETDSGPLTEALKEISKQFAEGTEGATALRDVFDSIIEAAGTLIRGAAHIGEALSAAFDTAKNAAETAYKFIIEHDPLLTPQFKHDELLRMQIDKETDARNKMIERMQTGEEKVGIASARGAKPEELRKIGKEYGLDIKAGDKEVDAHFKRRMHIIDEQRKALQSSGIVDPEHPGSVDPKTGRAAREPVSFEREGQEKLHKLGADAGKALHAGAASPEGLDAHSPSRKMFDLGLDAADGFRAGAQAGSEIAAHASAPTSSTSSKSVHVDVQVGGIHMQGMADLAEFMPLLESQIADVFERTALELGQ